MNLTAFDPTAAMPTGSGWHATALPMVTVSVLALWAVAYGLVFSSIQEHRSQHELHATFREQLAAETAPVSDPIRPGAPVAAISIPSIGVRDVIVVEGTNSADLEAGPGHRPDTPLPGQAGVSVLMGRSMLFGAPFHRLTELRAGAVVSVVTGQGSFRYQVNRVRRAGDPLPYPAPAQSGYLIVETSAPTGATSIAAHQTVYVDATLDGPPQAAASRRPASIASSEAPMRGDAGSLGALVAWLLVLVATLAAAGWAQNNWGMAPTVLVAVPVVIATVWVVTELAAQLLPNLL